LARPGRLAELYRLHAPGGIRLADLLTGGDPMAEDLFHDAFIGVAGRWTSLRNADAFGSYLRRAIINRTNSAFRRRRVERAYLERESSLFREELFELEGRDDELWRQVRSLPPKQRAAIVLRYYEYLPDDQIADLLRCRPGTVRSRISRGLETLRSIRGGERVGD
jgi:RNA polymerase sigma factor (sigma-70 family)